MSMTARIEVKGEDPVASLQDFLGDLLTKGGMSAVLTPARLPVNNSVMPTLIVDPEKLSEADPLAPVFPINAAKVASKLTRKPIGGEIALVLRPCEIRAFVELVKLNQARMDEVVLIGVDCLGAYGNRDYPVFSASDGVASTLRFYRNILEGKGTAIDGVDLSPACKACEHPIPDNADLVIGTIGVDTNDSFPIIAKTAKGSALLDRLGLQQCAEPEGRKTAVADLLARRTAYRDRMFVETGEATADIEKLMCYLGSCVNCYNCRVACPVCYCRECVFVTDVFDHEPSQYLRWAKRKGLLKMPTDTIFYHLTRLAHMSTACIGCGQCSNACPNDVPVMELFRTIAGHTQKAFGYEAGRSVEDDPPLSVFREKEFPEITGGKD
jgi:formate dehydrogenase subunit beta